MHKPVLRLPVPYFLLAMLLSCILATAANAQERKYYKTRIDSFRLEAIRYDDFLTLHTDSTFTFIRVRRPGVPGRDTTFTGGKWSANKKRLFLSVDSAGAPATITLMYKGRRLYLANGGIRLKGEKRYFLKRIY